MFDTWLSSSLIPKGLMEERKKRGLSAVYVIVAGGKLIPKEGGEG